MTTVAAFALAAFLGCSGHPPGVAGIDIDEDAVTSFIMERHDKDRSNSLSKSELSSLPPIEGNRSWYDTDKDGEISAVELEKGLGAIFDPRTGLVTFACEVSHNGRPLQGANVKFVPMPPLQDSIPEASSVTDKSGVAMLRADPEDLPEGSPTKAPFMRPGLYLVQVTHDSLKIPEQYNVNTKLGKEVSGYTTAGGPMKIQLKF
jgi:hypothetical protein